MKFRTSYPKELKVESKSSGKGLFTLNVRLPDGTTDERQGVVDATEARFLRWAAAMVADPRNRPLPDLEKFVREHIGREI